MTNTVLNKRKLFILSILFDLIGMLSYFLPFLGWLTDVVWAPIAAALLYKMYPKSVGKIGSVVVFIEEILPGLDVIPTFTITWFYTFYIASNKEQIIKK
jgi:hypothetical protein